MANPVELTAQKAQELANQWFAASYPRHSRPELELLAVESARCVFRVWYRPELPRRPSPYIVVAVDRVTNAVREIDLEVEPKFRKAEHL